jgi:hypothetical protein
MYRSIHIHFLTRIDRPLLEKMVQTLVSSNSVGMVPRVVDQYLDLVVLEPNLFHLNMPDSFVSYNVPSIGEAQIRQYMSRISMGLVSMARVLGVVPVIRAPPGGAAEMLAGDVCSILRDHLAPRGPAFPLFSDALAAAGAPAGPGGVSNRPLLLIFDRTMDMVPPLMHTSTYLGLIDDLLGLHLNKVTVANLSSGKDIGGKTGAKKSYDLNSQSDSFLAQFAGSPFPEAVEANEAKMNEVSAKEQEIRSKPGNIQGPSAAGSNPSVGGDAGSTKDLTAAIESLPEILARKASLETHTTLLQAAMKEIVARDIPTFFELELAMASSGRVDRAQVLSLLRDESKGTVLDKARLLAVTALVMYADAAAAGSKFDEFETAFSQGCSALLQKAKDGAGGDSSGSADSSSAEASMTRYLAVVTLMRRVQALQAPLSQRMSMGSGSGSGGAMLSSLLTTATSRASSLMAKATSFLAKFSPMAVTRVVDALSEGRACSEMDTYAYLDPRKPANAPLSAAPGDAARYSDVIVFVIGGGCYSEYFNLMELQKQKQTQPGGLRNVYYGCTELVNGAQFLGQLEKLGSM